MKADPRRIDLHMHTTVSDGTDTPEEILEKVRAAGIELFAVTDHDAVKGCHRVLPLLSPGDPRFLTGVEFSCRDEEGKYHILGYGYDPEAEAIRQVVAEGHGYRMKKVLSRLAYLKEQFGFDFPQEEINRLFALDNPGKPHIGNLMVKYGYAKSKDSAIRDYIDQIRFRSEYVRPETAIRGILEAGGIPVLAHPTYGSGRDRIVGDEMDRRLARLVKEGLLGVEVYYSSFGEEIREELLAFARKYHLYVTAGSDYHGTNKTVALGNTGFPEGEETPEGLLRFLEKAEELTAR